METITPKTIRRARTKLLSQAEAEARERDISVEEALQSIILKAATNENLQDIVIAAFSKLGDTSSPKPDEKQEIADYLEGDA